MTKTEEKKIDGSDTSKQITFADLGLDEKILKKIEAKGYKHPSAIQV
jgi:superfamily II DNA/RNA helicase